MRYLIIILSFLFTLSSCKSKQSLAKKASEKEKFLWTVILSNGKQENPRDMTQTKYIFLTNSDKKDHLCTGSSLIHEIAYRELWENDGSTQNPEWHLKKSNIEKLKARQVLDIACGNEDAQFGFIPGSKSEILMNNYLEFQKAP